MKPSTTTIPSKNAKMPHVAANNGAAPPAVTATADAAPKPKRARKPRPSPAARAARALARAERIATTVATWGAPELATAGAAAAAAVAALGKLVAALPADFRPSKPGKPAALAVGSTVHLRPKHIAAYLELGIDGGDALTVVKLAGSVALVRLAGSDISVALPSRHLARGAS